MKIWDFDKYRDYLEVRLGAEGSRTGLRKKLAAAIPVHTTFVSQVLKGRNEFSLEQGEAINSFLNHSESEGEFFLLLISKDRAGHEKLKSRFQNKINEIRETRMNIKNRIEDSSSISTKDREKFYSSFIYGAVHVLSAIPGYQSLKSLSTALNIPISKLKEIIEFMVRLGLLKEDQEKIISSSNHVHLENTSELVLKHHSNWRYHAISKMQFLDKNDLHYSACVSLSQNDVRRIKELILENLKKNIEIISSSKEETAYVFNFDFYKLINE